MSVYITGMAGFIGFHTALKLHEQGHKVSGCDNFNDYYDKRLKQDRADLLGDKGIHVDFLDIYYMESETLKDVDIVLHLAAHAGVRSSLANARDYIDTNILGTQLLIDACTEGEIPVVYASSSSVCAGNDMPFKEDSTFTHHSNPYSWSKYVNECQFKHSLLPWSIGLRFFTVYGPWGRPDMALFHFADRITEGKPIELYNHGNMQRDFTYVDDAVEGVYIALLLCYNRQIEKHNIYNIGFGQSRSLEDYVQLLEKGLNKTAEKILVPAHEADALATWADITKISKLGYQPTTSIEVGVRKFTEWYKEYYI